jgi:preprotein translocase subunit SecG
MVTVIALIHIIVCFLLIALVLLQDPKSSGGGSVFGGGGSNSLLGATGAVTFLTRITRYSAIIFGITCLILAKSILAGTTGASKSSSCSKCS